MGCTLSTEKAANSVDVNALSPRAVKTGTAPQSRLTPQQSKTEAHPVANVQVEPRAVITSFAQEDKIELIFKAKRANVFSAGLSANERSNFRAKIIHKTAAESSLIRKYRYSQVDIIYFIMKSPLAKLINYINNTNVYFIHFIFFFLKKQIRESIR